MQGHDNGRKNSIKKKTNYYIYIIVELSGIVAFSHLFKVVQGGHGTVTIYQ